MGSFVGEIVGVLVVAPMVGVSVGECVALTGLSDGTTVVASMTGRVGDSVGALVGVRVARTGFGVGATTGAFVGGGVALTLGVCVGDRVAFGTVDASTIINVGTTVGSLVGIMVVCADIAAASIWVGGPVLSCDGSVVRAATGDAVLGFLSGFEGALVEVEITGVDRLSVGDPVGDGVDICNIEGASVAYLSGLFWSALKLPSADLEELQLPTAQDEERSSAINATKAKTSNTINPRFKHFLEKQRDGCSCQSAKTTTSTVGESGWSAINSPLLMAHCI